MAKSIRRINVDEYKINVFDKKIIIKDKSGTISITLNETAKAFQFIKYLMNTNEKESIKFLEYYSARVFTHISLMSQRGYLCEFEEFLIKCFYNELNNNSTPKDSDILDKLKKIYNTK